MPEIATVNRAFGAQSHFAVDERFLQASPATGVISGITERRVFVPVNLSQRSIYYGRFTPQSTFDWHVYLVFSLKGQTVLQLSLRDGNAGLVYSRYTFCHNHRPEGTFTICDDCLFWNREQFVSGPTVLRPLKLSIACDEIYEQIGFLQVSPGIQYSSILAVKSNSGL